MSSKPTRPHTRTLTRSFAGGEMSPEMFSRVDDPKYQAGAETLLNMIPKPTGAAARRPGTRMVRVTRDASKTAHLMPFVFSPTQSVVIEASRAEIAGVDSGYLRFHTNGGSLLFTQPGSRFSAPVDSDPTTAFMPIRSVTCTVASPTVVSLADHGLSTGDTVQFVGDLRTVPSDLTYYKQYYVRYLTSSTFELAQSRGNFGPSLNVLTHFGLKPVMFNMGRWQYSKLAKQGFSVPEHRIEDKAPITVTMWPSNLNPTVDFVAGGWGFRATQVKNGHRIGLRTTHLSIRQQVLFAGDSGAVMPSGITEGRLYWVTAWDASTGIYTISETFGGPRHPIGTGASGVIRMSCMPEPNDLLEFSCLKRYYAVSDLTNEPNVLKLDHSIAAGQASGGGLYFYPETGTGPYKIHQAHEVGDIVSYPDGAGGVKSYYCERNWWDGEVTITEEMHNADGPRVPGARTTAYEGAYWREMEGITTGGDCPVAATEDGAGGDLTLTPRGGAAHGFETGQQVAFTGGVMPSGITVDTAYYAIDDGATFRLATTYAKAMDATAAPDINNAVQTGAVSGGSRNGGLMVRGFVTFDTSTESGSIRWPGHDLIVGETIVFDEYSGSTSQTGITAGTVYYVRNAVAGTVFRISATAAGPLIEFDGDGSLVGAIGNSIYEVPHDYGEDEISKIVTTQSGDVMTMTSKDHPVAELRRLSASKWEVIKPEFTAAVGPPSTLFESAVELGEGTLITSVFIGLGRYQFVCSPSMLKHTFVEGNPVYVSGLSSVNVSDGYYTVGYHSGVGATDPLVIYLKDIDTGVEVQHSGNKTGLTGYIRYGTQGEERTQTYVVTSVDKNNEESVATEELEVENNLYVSGSSNTIGWATVGKAVRYRIYKQSSGLFGLIGETDDLTFKDDNIGPDLAVAPPIADSSLREESVVTFDQTGNSIGWVDHGLLSGMPVVFSTTDEMPGIEEGKTYFVLNPGDDKFEISETEDGDGLDITGTDTGTHTAISGDFPASATYFEGRRVFGGSRARPQDVWMTASGTESDLTYSIPTVASDRIYFRIASREISAIRHLVPMSQLMMLSDSTEYRLTPINDDALTPSSISVRPQSFVGAGYPVPSLVNNNVVFAAARGGHMRELGYSRDVSGYLTGDLSIRSAHLFDGFTIVDQAYAKAPVPIVWCVSSNGKLLGLTYIPEEGIGAWHQHDTAESGVFESVCSVPEGDEDAVYVVVQRNIGGLTRRFVERFSSSFRGDTDSLDDAFFVDSGLTYDDVPTLIVGGLEHLNNVVVDYLADGLVGSATVVDGSITLAVAASKVHVGLGFTSTIKTVPLSMMKVAAFGTGKPKNINQVWVRTFQSGAFKVGPAEDKLRPSKVPVAGALADALVQVSLTGSWDDDGQVFIQQSTPLPLTVSGITIEVASGG